MCETNSLNVGQEDAQLLPRSTFKFYTLIFLAIEFYSVKKKVKMYHF